MDATYYGADTGNIEMQMISQQAGDKMEDLKAAFALAFPGADHSQTLAQHSQLCAQQPCQP